MMLFTKSQAVIEVGVSYLRVDGLVLPVYAFFIWVFIYILRFDYWGVWCGAAVSVILGSLLSLAVAFRISKSEIGGLKISIEHYM